MAVYLKKVKDCVLLRFFIEKEMFETQLLSDFDFMDQTKGLRIKIKSEICDEEIKESFYGTH